VNDHDDDHDDQMLPQPEGDAEGGYSYDGASVPLMTRHRVESQGDVVFDGDAELEQLRAQQPPEEGAKIEFVPYAHRDIKPG
jgi:serine/threonine kinase 16